MKFEVTTHWLLVWAVLWLAGTAVIFIFLHMFGEDTRWIVNSASLVFVNVMGIALTVMVVVFAMTQQYRTGLQDQVKVELYESISASAERASRRLAQSQGSVLSLAVDIDFGVYAVEPILSYEVLDERHSEADSSLQDLLGTMHSYEIVSTDLASLRADLVWQRMELQDAFRELSSNARLLGSDGGPVAQTDSYDLEQQGWEELVRAARVYVAASQDVQDNVFDFRVRSQNALLGHLFGAEVPGRQPVDSRQQQTRERVARNTGKLLSVLGEAPDPAAITSVRQAAIRIWTAYPKEALKILSELREPPEPEEVLGLVRASERNPEEFRLLQIAFNHFARVGNYAENLAMTSAVVSMRPIPVNNEPDAYLSKWVDSLDRPDAERTIQHLINDPSSTEDQKTRLEAQAYRLTSSSPALDVRVSVADPVISGGAQAEWVVEVSNRSSETIKSVTVQASFDRALGSLSGNNIVLNRGFQDAVITVHEGTVVVSLDELGPTSGYVDVYNVFLSTPAREGTFCARVVASAEHDERYTARDMSCVATTIHVELDVQSDVGRVDASGMFQPVSDESALRVGADMPGVLAYRVLITNRSVFEATEVLAVNTLKGLDGFLQLKEIREGYPTVGRVVSISARGFDWEIGGFKAASVAEVQFFVNAAGEGDVLNRVEVTAEQISGKVVEERRTSLTN